MKKYAVIVAGGAGSRMGSDIPKQFLPLLGKPVLYYSIRIFLESDPDITVVLVVPENFMSLAKDMVDNYFGAERIEIIAGGDTRFQSVKNGLMRVGQDGIIFVHDAARCLLTTGLVARCYETAMEMGSAIPAIVSKDSVRLKTNGGSEPLNREHVLLVQTPQTFQSNILLPAYDSQFRELFTDEATVAEANGHMVTLVEGEADNIKITWPMDLVFAEKILENRGYSAEKND